MDKVNIRTIIFKQAESLISFSPGEKKENQSEGGANSGDRKNEACMNSYK